MASGGPDDPNGPNGPNGPGECNNLAALGRTLRRTRQARGLSLGDLARAVGVSKAYLSMIENGRVANPPSAELLDRLEASLRMQAGELRRAAEWAKTPAAVREQVERLHERAEQSRAFAEWIRAATAPDAGGGKNLDRLFRSGQLTKRVRQLLEPGQQADNPTPSAATQGGISRETRPARPGRSIPLINRVAAGYPTGFTDLDYPARAADDYVAAPVDDPDAFAATVVGDSMLPDYRAGDIVIFSPLADVDDGADCFVRIDPDHETTFKRVFFDNASNTIRLQPLNPRFAPSVLPREHVAGLYRAVWRLSALL